MQIDWARRLLKAHPCPGDGAPERICNAVSHMFFYPFLVYSGQIHIAEHWSRRIDHSQGLLLIPRAQHVQSAESLLRTIATIPRRDFGVAPAYSLRREGEQAEAQ